MIEQLGDRAIDTSLFDPTEAQFEDAVLPTTWEELERLDYVDEVAGSYRLTAKGWLIGVEASRLAQSESYVGRLGHLFATMKSHVKGRKASAVVDLPTLARESGEPEGWIFNVIDSRATTSEESQRTGATWFDNERGRLVEIPVDFNLEPLDVVSALTIRHLERIEELEARLEEFKEDRAQFHCPYCDAPVASIGHQDYPEHHCIVTYQSYECGYSTGDGYEESPCPYGPKWPRVDEFDFVTEQQGTMWLCTPRPKTDRARRANVYVREIGCTKEEAEERARKKVAPKKSTKNRFRIGSI
jgi:hypothetical protein